MVFSGTDRVCVHKWGLPLSRFESSVAKKPHIALNGRAFSHDRVFLARVCVPTWAVGREGKVGGNMETMMTFRAVGLRSLWLKCFTLLWVAGVCSSATSALAAD